MTLAQRGGVNPCAMRSVFHRRPMSHLWSTFVRVRDRPDEVRCSWCWERR